MQLMAQFCGAVQTRSSLRIGGNLQVLELEGLAGGPVIVDFLDFERTSYLLNHCHDMS
jgi:hypothetical protein